MGANQSRYGAASARGLSAQPGCWVAGPSAGGSASRVAQLVAQADHAFDAPRWRYMSRATSAIVTSARVVTAGLVIRPAAVTAARLPCSRWRYALASRLGERP